MLTIINAMSRTTNCGETTVSAPLWSFMQAVSYEVYSASIKDNCRTLFRCYNFYGC
jgi:hypothetical protein